MSTLVNKVTNYREIPENDPHYRKDDTFAVESRDNIVFYSGKPITLENFKTMIEEMGETNPRKPFYKSVLSGRKWDFKTKTSHVGRKWTKAPESQIQCLHRPVTTEELERSKVNMKCDPSNKDTLAPPNTRPKAVLIVGVGGAGKSTICRKLRKYFDDFDINKYCIFDGDLLRKELEDYQKITNGDPSVGCLNAWPAIKPHTAMAKWKILNSCILPEKRNVIISTGVHGQRYYKVLKENGYAIDVVGIHVSWKEAIYRGINRSQWTGRSYLGTKEMWEIAKKDMHALARRTPHRSIIIDNTDFCNPIELFLKKKEKK